MTLEYYADNFSSLALGGKSLHSVEKFFLFYKKIKFHNITRENSAPKFVKEWVEKKRREEGVSLETKGEFLIKKGRQENSQQIKQFLDKVGEDFTVTYVDDLPSQGLPWGDSLLETLVDLGDTTEYKEIFTKMQKVSLNQEDVILLKKAFTAQVEEFNSSYEKPGDEEPVGEKPVDEVQGVTPDQVVGPKERKVWLNKVGEE